MQGPEGKLKIVRLLEPDLCLSCRFAAIGRVEMTNGSVRSMLVCGRLDCDNWQEENNKEVPTHIEGAN